MPRLQCKKKKYRGLQKGGKMTILLPNSFENSYLKYRLQEFQKVKVCRTSTVQFLNTYIEEMTIYLCNARHRHFMIGPNLCVCIYIRTHTRARARESGRTLFRLQHNSSANEFTSYCYKNSNKFALVIKCNYVGAKLLFKRRTDVYFKWSFFFLPGYEGRIFIRNVGSSVLLACKNTFMSREW